MTRHCPTLFKRQKSRYISWNILFFSGFGLWIALCTSNMYHSNILAQKALFFYQQNSDFGIGYNTSTEIESMEDMLYIMPTDYALSNITVILRDLLNHIHIFAFICFIILSIYMQEHIRNKIEVWNNIFRRRCNFSSITSYLCSLTREHNESDIFNKKIHSNDHIVLQCELSVNSEIGIKQKTLPNDQTKINCAWIEQKDENISKTNITIVQNKIVFNGYALLLFNNYELYRYFNNQQLKNTYNSLTRYLAIQGLKYIECDVRPSSEKNDNLPLNKCIRKGVISSSPEFKRFLENLKRSQFFHPFMVEVSTSYIICIKSIYK